MFYYENIDTEDESQENRELCLRILESNDVDESVRYCNDTEGDITLRSENGSAYYEEGDYTYSVVPTKTRDIYDPNCDCSHCESNFDSADERFHEVIEEVDDPDDDHDEWHIKETYFHPRKPRFVGPFKSFNKAKNYLWNRYIANSGDNYIFEIVSTYDCAHYSTELAEEVVGNWVRELEKKGEGYNLRKKYDLLCDMHEHLRIALSRKYKAESIQIK